ncbi:hypothetical protein [Streptomyces cucumeris]|uniref:hypothetical protein n=1 Tax=Streptomyces cucumeris TaxID=2962890 RepID=UPI0020C8C8DF|nr:hypothetical protein [Streptomyces sp. NEAU-Y11]MCP9208966.1 hypothetical protein [Streptomyces sp. NEAU-Y11]
MLAKLSDRILSAVLREERAGACVPEHGERCYCKSGKVYRFNCNGICTKSTTSC